MIGGRIAAAFSLWTACAVAAQGGEAQDIGGQVPLFCRDSTGAFQPIQRTSYARLQESFIRQFGYRHSLHATSPTLGVLAFSNDGTPGARERISYDVQPHEGGIALLHMHVRLRGVTEDLSGTAMCGKTFGIVNAR